MKIIEISLFLVVITSTVLISCSNEDCDGANPAVKIDQRFIHELSNCVDGSDFEVNCTEFVFFRDSSNVDVLIGGGDMIDRLTYQRLRDTIKIENKDFQQEITFRIQSSSVLIRLEDNEIWRRD